MLELGKLYQIKQHCWLLYPEKNTARSLDLANASAQDVHACLDEWNEDLEGKKIITYISPRTVFFPVEIDGLLLKVISANGELGWMIYPENESYTEGCIEELKEEHSDA